VVESPSRAAAAEKLPASTTCENTRMASQRSMREITTEFGTINCRFATLLPLSALSYFAGPQIRKKGQIMIDARTAPYAATLLRVSLGFMFIAHSLLLKHFTYTLAGTVQFFESLGLPAALAYGTFWAELVGGVLLVLGLGSRWVAVALVPILAGALWVHAGNGWVFSAANGGWEYPLFLIAASFVQALLGDGAYALGNRVLKPNGSLTSLTSPTAAS
jgi:putative oxidoreductase